MTTITEASDRRKALHQRLDDILDRAETDAADATRVPQLDGGLREAMLSLGEEVAVHALTSAAPALRQAGRLPACPKCCEPMKFKQHRDTRVRTALTGEPQVVPAPVAVCPKGCPVLVNLLRRGLRLDAEGRTPRLCELAGIAGTIEPFEPAAAQVLGQLAGITMSANGVHGICQELGDVALRLMEAGQLGDARQLHVGEVLYVMADGCMVWVDDGWHEVKFSVIFPSSANIEVSKDRHCTQERQVICTQGDRDDLGQMVWNAVARWLPPDGHGGVRTRDRIVFLSDGSLWLRNMVDEYLPGAFVLLDWYHMAEHLAATAKALHGDDEIGARRWRKEQESLLMEGRVTAMLAGLLRRAADGKLTAAVRESLHELHGFLDKRKDALKYSTARGKGYLIGSGPVESAANHVVQQRMKRAGMRWEHDGATAMLALRSAWRSNGGFAAVARAA